MSASEPIHRAERFVWTAQALQIPPARRPLRVLAQGPIIVRNISETGLLLHGLGALEPRRVLVADLPEGKLTIPIAFHQSRQTDHVLSVSTEDGARDRLREVLATLATRGLLSPGSGAATKIENSCFSLDDCPNWPSTCTQCTLPVEDIHEPDCPRCTHVLPSPPNLLESCRPKHRKTLKDAFDTNTRHLTTDERDLARLVIDGSVAVIACRAETLRAVLTGVLPFPNYHEMFESDQRLPDDPGFAHLRLVADTIVNPNNKQRIRFAAVSLDGRGVARFGPCWITVADGLLRSRASVFFENSLFADYAVSRAGARGGLGAAIDSLNGKRAAWNHRDYLAVAKLGTQLRRPLNVQSVAAALLKDGVNPPDDEFVEVHVDGHVPVDAFEKVSVPRGLADLEDLRTLCQKANVPFHVRPQ